MYLKSEKSPMNHLKQKGIGLPATVFLIVILALIIVAMSELTEHSSLGYGQDYESMRTFYAAESGAQIALNRLFVGAQACSATKVDLDFDSINDNPGLNNCVATLSCTQDSVAGIEYYTFLSEATCGTGFELSQRTIQVRAHDVP